MRRLRWMWKSVTAGAVVTSLEASQHEQALVTFFADPSSNNNITACDVVRAQIKQLVARFRECDEGLPRDAASALTKAFPHAKAIPDLGTLTDILKMLVAGLGSCVFVTDGLDILQEREVVSYLQVVRVLFASVPDSVSHCRMIIFCRETLGRGIRIDTIPRSTTLRIGISHLRRDIHKYIDHEVAAKQLDRNITRDEQLLQEIKDVLKANCAKMYASDF